MKKPENINRFDCAVRGVATDRPPIWFMRQAGRYLPEYREVRKSHSFDAMLQNSEIATEITLQPIRRFDLDAAVIFADIMTILNGLDIPFNFDAGGPTLNFDLTQKAELEKLSDRRIQDNISKFKPFLTAIQNTRAALPADKSVIGFAASPFTLLSYLIEGTTSKTHNQTRAFMYSQPVLFEKMLTDVADCTIAYLQLQFAAGASAVQIFESWGDVLSGPEYAQRVWPAVKRIITALQASGPVIFYDKGASLHITSLRAELSALAVMASVDWRIDISTLSDLRVQGNLDPAVLESDAKTTAKLTRETIEKRQARPGYIFNLGHGITPQAHLACVEAMVSTVQTYKGS
jgi:uroporphyrinogen decarboxylase